MLRLTGYENANHCLTKKKTAISFFLLNNDLHFHNLLKNLHFFFNQDDLFLFFGCLSFCFFQNFLFSNDLHFVTGYDLLNGLSKS